MQFQNMEEFNVCRMLENNAELDCDSSPTAETVTKYTLSCVADLVHGISLLILLQNLFQIQVESN